jgi:single-strand DNA-binding protein
MQTEIVFIGHLGSDVELAETKTGKKVATFNVAVNIPGKEKPVWHKVRRWDIKAEQAAEKLHKGIKVFVKGSLTYDSWEDSNKQKHKVAIIEASRVERFKNETVELNM